MDNVSTWLVVGGMLLLAVAIVVFNDWTVAWSPDVEVGKGLTPAKYEIRIDREESPATGGGRKKMTGDNGGKSGGDSVEPGSGR